MSEPLVAEPALRRLALVAASFPGDVLAALEVRLAAPEDRVDLSLRLTTPAQARAAAALAFSQPLCSVLEAWSRSPAMREQTPAIWLEHDLHPETDGLPEPIVCLQVAPAIDPAVLGEELLPAWLGRALTACQRELITQSRALAGRLLYVFNLQARASTAVRLEILGRNTAESVRDFERLSGTAAPAELVRAAQLLTSVERPHLSVDVDDELLPRIGLEGSFRRLPHREPRWAELLERLVDVRLCAAEKRDALLAWPGVDTRRTAGERWPREVSRGWCVRSLSHFKLVAEPGRALEAKAYLTLQHLERPGSPHPPGPPLPEGEGGTGARHF